MADQPLAFTYDRRTTHATSDSVDHQALAGIAGVYEESVTPAVPRTPAAIEALFTGLELIDPGLVDMSQWRSDMPETSGGIRFLAGAGRLTATAPGITLCQDALTRAPDDE